MRYVKEHKLQTRSRIVEMASYGLRQNGADGVSVAHLMKLAGLTHGGFYSHFESRDALVVEAFAWLWIGLSLVGWNLRGKCPSRNDSMLSWTRISLGADIARSNQKARRRLARKLEEMIDVLARLLPQKSPAEARQVATGAIATMMGSIVLARAAGNKMLSDDILDAGRQAVRNQAAVRTAK
jgi:TetR/AcrR family transcriptional regulator, transcriptional repressor for nem operon